MMKYRQLTVSVGRTVNLGNYESIRKELGVVIELDEDDDIEEIQEVETKKLQDEVDVWGREQKAKGQGWSQ